MLRYRCTSSFLNTTPHFRRSSRHVLLNPKTDLEKNETATGLKNLMAYRHTTRIMPKLRGRIFRRFWVKEPRQSETIFAKKRYASIVSTRLKQRAVDTNTTTRALCQQQTTPQQATKRDNTGCPLICCPYEGARGLG